MRGGEQGCTGVLPGCGARRIHGLCALEIPEFGLRSASTSAHNPGHERTRIQRGRTSLRLAVRLPDRLAVRGRAWTSGAVRGVPGCPSAPQPAWHGQLPDSSLANRRVVRRSRGRRNPPARPALRSLSGLGNGELGASYFRARPRLNRWGCRDRGRCSATPSRRRVSSGIRRHASRVLLA